MGGGEKSKKGGHSITLNFKHRLNELALEFGVDIEQRTWSDTDYEADGECQNTRSVQHKLILAQQYLPEILLVVMEV